MRFVFAVALLTALSIAQSQVAIGGVEVWKTVQPGALSFLTAAPLIGTDAFSLFWVTQQYNSESSLTSYACAVGNMMDGPKCAAAPSGASFMSSPIPAGAASLVSPGTSAAFAWSTQVNSGGNSSIAYLVAGPQVTPQVNQRSQSKVAYEAAVPFINPGEFLVRFTDTSATVAATTIQRVSIVDQKLTFLTSYTVAHFSDSRLSPTEATAIYVYEGFTYFMVQDKTQAWLYKVNSSVEDPHNATKFALPDPCQLSPSGDSMVHLLVAPYAEGRDGSQLYALLMWGKLANGSAALCRVSHRYGVPEFNVSGSIVQVFPEIDKIATVSLGGGYAVVTGTSKLVPNAAFVYSLNAASGVFTWPRPLQRHVSDQSNMPVIYNYQVYLSIRGALAWLPTETQNLLPSTSSTVSCVLAALVTPKRIYCVQDGRMQVVGISVINGIEVLLNWTAPGSPVAFPVQAWPTDPSTIVVTLSDGTIHGVSNTMANPPPADDDSHGGAIAAAILVPLFLVGGFAAAYYYFAKRGVRRAAKRVAMEDDAGGGYATNNASEGTSLYGST